MKNLNVSKAIAFHNEFSLYSYLLFIFSTAIRALKTPKFTVAYFDAETHYLAVKDKEKESGDNTRVVILPSITRQQLDFYQSHVQFLYAKISLVCPSLLNLVVAEGIEEVSQTLFFIDEKSLKIQVFSQALLEKALRERGYSVPLNSNRHFLRSTLLERRCEVELVDLFLGHTDHICGAWVKDMAMHWAELTQLIEKHLVPILTECGWRALPGLGGRRI